MSSVVRRIGTLMILVGAGVLVWCLLVWQWQDPFTALYTKYRQHQLASQYAKRSAAYEPAPIAHNASLAVARRAIAREARSYRKAAKPGQAIGRIKIARLGVNMILVNGTDHNTLKRGPGRDPDTFMPGQNELVYVAGHRTTYLAPFAHIERLRRGDGVTLELPYATFRYQIVRHVIVPANDVSRLVSHHHELLALQACHPRFFASHRYIAYARLTRVEPRNGPAYSLKSALAARASN
ncbi:MAG: class D sortase [Actinomycetota bacterium]|nr:class D sortase [Actinomycetota bacterium]